MTDPIASDDESRTGRIDWKRHGKSELLGFVFLLPALFLGLTLPGLLLDYGVPKWLSGLSVAALGIGAVFVLSRTRAGKWSAGLRWSAFLLFVFGALTGAPAAGTELAGPIGGLVALALVVVVVVGLQAFMARQGRKKVASLPLHEQPRSVRPGVVKGDVVERWANRHVAGRRIVAPYRPVTSSVRVVLTGVDTAFRLSLEHARSGGRDLATELGVKGMRMFTNDAAARETFLTPDVLAVLRRIARRHDVLLFVRSGLMEISFPANLDDEKAHSAAKSATELLVRTAEASFPRSVHISDPSLKPFPVIQSQAVQIPVFAGIAWIIVGASSAFAFAGPDGSVIVKLGILVFWWIGVALASVSSLWILYAHPRWRDCLASVRRGAPELSRRRLVRWTFMLAAMTSAGLALALL